jgi:hypothetical protein
MCSIAGRVNSSKGGTAAFEQESSRELGRLKRKVAALEERLASKHAVLAEITEQYVQCKKTMDSFKSIGISIIVCHLVPIPL